MNKKMTLLAGAISSVLSSAALASLQDVVISEVVDGKDSAKNRAVEITNLGGVDYTFPDHIELSKQANGGTWYTINNSNGDSALAGLVLPTGKSAVVYYYKSDSDRASDEIIKNIADNGGIAIQGNSNLNGNGNDTWALRDVSDSDSPVILDVVGYADSDQYFGTDVTLRRFNTLPNQKNSYDPGDWSIADSSDQYSHLGNPELIAPPTPLCSQNPSSQAKYIGEVQGVGKFSPLITSGYVSEEYYKVSGTVSAVTNNPVSGFYLYDNNADGDVLSSDGIFVPASDVADVTVGQEVCVYAKVQENYGLTQLLAHTGKWEVTNSSVTNVEPVSLVSLSSDDSFSETLERYEGMLVTTVEDMGKNAVELAAIEEKVQSLTIERNEAETEDEYQTRLSDAKDELKQELMSVKTDMRVSKSFSYDYSARRNNITLSFKRPNPQPNQDHVAGSQASLDQADQNDDYRLLLESDTKAQNGQIPYYPQFNDKPNENYIRINDSVIGATGVIGYSYGNFTLTVPALLESKNSSEIKFVHNTDRDSLKINEYYGKDGFTIKVATQNVLNYFNSPYGGSDNQFGDNRGAESELEFNRQQTKIVEAIHGLDADILGLMEIENNGFGDFGAMKELLAAVNAKYTKENYADRNDKDSIHNRYVFVGFDKNGDTVLDEEDTIGSDSITTGLIYRPSKVSVISGQVIPMPWQDAPMIVDENNAPIIDSKGEVRENGKNYQRNTVTATFKVNNTGKKLTVAVNHLKSKGSTCYEDWKGWQDWYKFDPKKDKVRNDDFQGNCEHFRVAAVTHLGEELAKIEGDKVVLGDFNAYAHEDPMLVMTSNPTGKEIYAAGYTKIGSDVQFGPEGKKITKTFGYINAVDLFTPEGETSWSYSYNDEIGSLDHLLVSKNMQSRLVDAKDWHINAPESALFDYENEHKYALNDQKKPVNQKGELLTEDNLNAFYSEDPYRSSDHDSAIVSIGYKYNEAGETPISIAAKSGRADIAFPVSASAQKNDIAEISISPQPKGIALPQVKLTKNGEQTIMFDVAGLDEGTYTISMTLKGERAAAQNAGASSSTVIESKSMEVNISKRDSSNVKPVYPEYDGSGGSFGFGALLSLFGLGFLRRRKA
jgi:predicted extracellular nuclease